LLYDARRTFAVNGVCKARVCHEMGRKPSDKRGHRTHAGPPVRDQSPYPILSAIMITKLGFVLAATATSALTSTALNPHPSDIVEFTGHSTYFASWDAAFGAHMLMYTIVGGGCVGDSSTIALHQCRAAGRRGVGGKCWWAGIVGLLLYE
jgi:hypothetical protein